MYNTAVMYTSVMCTQVKNIADIHTEVTHIINDRNVHSSLEDWSVLHSVLYDADTTVAKDTAVLLSQPNHNLNPNTTKNLGEIR